MAIMHARYVTIEWDDGSKDVWSDVTIQEAQTGAGGTHPASPEATAIKYKTIILMEDKVVAHEPSA